jgi:hypothetical protein
LVPRTKYSTHFDLLKEVLLFLVNVGVLEIAQVQWKAGSIETIEVPYYTAVHNFIHLTSRNWLVPSSYTFAFNVQTINIGQRRIPFFQFLRYLYSSIARPARDHIFDWHGTPERNPFDPLKPYKCPYVGNFESPVTALLPKDGIAPGSAVTEVD